MSEPPCFLDTNVLLRHYLQDHSDRSPRASSLISSIDRGLREVHIAETVIFEASYTLEKSYSVPRAIIRQLLLDFLVLPGVILSGKTMFPAVFDLYVLNPGLSIADCYHIELARHFTNGAIYSFDRRFGTVEGVNRLEP